MTDLRQSEKYGRYMETLGWTVIKILNTKFEGPNKFEGADKSKVEKRKTQIFIKKLGIFGAIAKVQRVELPLLWEEVERVLKAQWVWMCKVEPDERAVLPKKWGSDLEKHGFYPDKWPLSVSKTLVVDLIPSEKEILAGFKKDARYSLRKCNSYNIQCTIDEFGEFYRMWKKAARIKKLWIPKEKSLKAMARIFGEDCFCLVAKNGRGEALGGVFVLITEKTAYYYFSAALPEGKKINVSYLTVWEAMKIAKKKGCVAWDFEGIYDERWPNKDWLGFSHFKKSFGGKIVEYAGSFVKWRWPI